MANYGDKYRHWSKDKQAEVDAQWRERLWEMATVLIEAQKYVVRIGQADYSRHPFLYVAATLEQMERASYNAFVEFDHMNDNGPRLVVRGGSYGERVHRWLPWSRMTLVGSAQKVIAVVEALDAKYKADVARGQRQTEAEQQQKETNARGSKMLGFPVGRGQRHNPDAEDFNLKWVTVHPFEEVRAYRSSEDGDISFGVKLDKSGLSAEQVKAIAAILDGGK